MMHHATTNGSALWRTSAHDGGLGRTVIRHHSRVGLRPGKGGGVAAPARACSPIDSATEDTPCR